MDECFVAGQSPPKEWVVRSGFNGDWHGETDEQQRFVMAGDILMDDGDHRRAGWQAPLYLELAATWLPSDRVVEASGG